MIIVIKEGYVLEVHNNEDFKDYQVVDLDLFDKQAVVSQAETKIRIKNDSLETILSNFKIDE